MIEKILRHLNLWPKESEPACLSRVPPNGLPPDGGERVIEPCFNLSRRSPAKADDPFPDYDTEPVMAYANDPDFAA